jgi:integrase
MARPRLEQPRYRLVVREGRYYVRWWREGWHRISARTADRREAERFLAQLVAGTLEPTPPEQPTISAILNGYLADRKPMVASFATLEYACAALRRHLGDLTTEHLTTTRARLYARQRRAEGYAAGGRRKPVQNGTVAREIVTLRAALRWAVKAKWITAAPEIEAPSAGKPRDRWLTRADAAQLLAACQAPHVRLFVALGLYTAARAGALLALTWGRVDFVRGVIDLGEGVGNKRRNPVPIPDALRPFLLEARSGATIDAVIEHGGRPVASVKTGFNAACRRAGLVAVTPHTLRHTAASWMVAGGVPLAEVARYLGDSERTVERVYAKHSPDYLRGAAKVLGGE